MKLFQLLPEKIVHLTCNWPNDHTRIDASIIHAHLIQYSTHATFSHIQSRGLPIVLLRRFSCMSAQKIHAFHPLQCSCEFFRILGWSKRGNCCVLKTIRRLTRAAGNLYTLNRSLSASYDAMRDRRHPMRAMQEPSARGQEQQLCL